MITARLPKLRRLFTWKLYAVLLAASFLTQWFRPGTAGHQADAVTSFMQVPIRTTAGDSGQPSVAVRIAYRSYGSPAAPALLLLHGSPGVAANFEHLVPMLTPYFHVIVPDLPGFGASDPWLPDYSIRAHARYMFELLDALKVDKVQVLGFSMGSGVALNMADISPERLTSITLYGGIGIQEGEGSGSYALEHLKYGLGYGFLVIGPELVPHFGLMGPRTLRHAFIRNFWDTDQRPLRQILERLRTPLLILHGVQDPLVHAWVAEEHHRIVPTSEYVLFNSSHFMLFDEGLTGTLANELLPFLRRHIDPAAPATPRTTRYAPTPVRPAQIARPTLTMLTLALATFAGEDLTCITAGELVSRGMMDLFVAVFGCMAGIFLGDVLLWAIGRTAGRGALRIGWIARRLPAARLQSAARWLDENTVRAVFTARFVPGLRLPTYLAAGIMGGRTLRLLVATAAAALVWTPLLVISVAFLGDTLIGPLRKYFGGGLSLVLAVLIGWCSLHLVTQLMTGAGRADLRLKLARLRRWEFWPMWLFYPPVLLWIAWLAIRHRSLGVVTTCNPGILHGGLVGESKFDILALSKSPRIVPTTRHDPADAGQATAAILHAVEAGGWGWPIILKPDVGQRGAGVKLARSHDDVAAYVAAAVGPVIAQPYHPGPFEAGVMYYRMPGEPHGRIFSITDKVFPFVTGDGRRSLESLILSHPRYRLQSATFFARHAANLSDVPGDGVVIRLAVAGNHCQGTLFRDGGYLITPALEAAVDELARSFQGFYFGRFDVRYSAVEAFKAGRDLAVIELNGATSESTNIYDPGWSLLRAYGVLFRQWSILFRVGAANRKAGARASTVGEVARDALRYYRGKKAASLAD